jgi:hypothetical protein
MDPAQDPRNSIAEPTLKASAPITGTLAETYLRSRGIELEPDLPLRFKQLLDGAAALIAPVVDIHTNKLLTLHATLLAADGSGKADVTPNRLFLGARGLGVVKLTPDEDVTSGLAIAEGIESALSAPFRPIWACLDASTLSRFPVLAGIQCLTVYADHDDAGTKAAFAVGRRWKQAGREVRILRPCEAGQDLNDLVRAA